MLLGLCNEQPARLHTRHRRVLAAGPGPSAPQLGSLVWDNDRLGLTRTTCSG